MKIGRLVMVSFLFFAVACSDSGGGGSSGAPTAQPSQPIKTCDVVFKKTDTMAEAAVKGDRARNECGLSEQEVERLLDAAI